MLLSLPSIRSPSATRLRPHAGLLSADGCWPPPFHSPEASQSSKKNSHSDVHGTTVRSEPHPGLPFPRSREIEAKPPGSAVDVRKLATLGENLEVRIFDEDLRRKILPISIRIP